MRYSFTFYIHHHGAGHITRVLEIVKTIRKQCSCDIALLGTGLSKYLQDIPNGIKTIDLPPDIPNKEDSYHCLNPVRHLHYSPLNIANLVERNALIVEHLRENPKTICIIDVSCEVTQLVRLCGVPSVVVRQHGNRTDLAHQLAYESAAHIIAPYSQEMSSDVEEGRYAAKTLFSGGFSRFDGHSAVYKEQKDHIALIVGKGGTNLGDRFLRHLQTQLSGRYTLHVIGDVDGKSLGNNIVFHGHLPDPSAVLDRCTVVLCNAGHNTIMEMASLRKRIVCIPASRPFAEQINKALHLERLGLAVMVREELLYQTDWKAILQQAADLDTSRWASIMCEDAREKISLCLQDIYESFFEKPRMDEIKKYA